MMMTMKRSLFPLRHAIRSAGRQSPRSLQVRQSTQRLVRLLGSSRVHPMMYITFVSLSGGSNTGVLTQNLRGAFGALKLDKCQSLVDILGEAHSHLEADVKGSLVELEVVQSQLQSAVTAVVQSKMKLSAAVERLEELKNSDQPSKGLVVPTLHFLCCMVGTLSHGIECVSLCFWMCGKWFEKKAQSAEKVHKSAQKVQNVK